MGSELVYYKGLRRGAIAKILMLGKLLTFKVITYNTDSHKLYFNDIHKGTRLNYVTSSPPRGGGKLLITIFDTFF